MAKARKTDAISKTALRGASDDNATEIRTLIAHYQDAVRRKDYTASARLGASLYTALKLRSEIRYALECVGVNETDDERLTKAELAIASSARVSLDNGKRLDVLEARGKDWATDIKGVHSRLGTAERRLDSHENSGRVLANALDEHETRIGQLDGSLTADGDAYPVNPKFVAPV